MEDLHSKLIQVVEKLNKTKKKLALLYQKNSDLIEENENLKQRLNKEANYNKELGNDYKISLEDLYGQIKTLTQKLQMVITFFITIFKIKISKAYLRL